MIVHRATYRLGILLVCLQLILLTVGCERDDESPRAGEQAASSEGQQQKPRANRPGFAHDNIVLLESAADAPAEFKRGLDDLFTSYLQLVEALGANDLGQVDAVARQMLSSASALAPPGLDGEAAEAWDNHKKVITEALEQVLRSESPADKREHFDHISKVMYCTLASFDRPSEPAYLQYCPAAFGGGGAYWLTDEENVSANPYLPGRGGECAELQHKL